LVESDCTTECIHWHCVEIDRTTYVHSSMFHEVVSKYLSRAADQNVISAVCMMFIKR
jgi:hypothetical protein